jgi:hypothetical protein
MEGLSLRFSGFCLPNSSIFQKFDFSLLRSYRIRNFNSITLADDNVNKSRGWIMICVNRPELFIKQFSFRYLGANE